MTGEKKPDKPEEQTWINKTNERKKHRTGQPTWTRFDSFIILRWKLISNTERQLSSYLLGTKNQSGRCMSLNIIESWQVVVKEIPSGIHTQVNQSLQKWLPELFLLSSNMPAVHQLHKVLQCTPHLSSCIPKKNNNNNKTEHQLGTDNHITFSALWNK